MDVQSVSQHQCCVCHFMVSWVSYYLADLVFFVFFYHFSFVFCIFPFVLAFVCSQFDSSEA